MPDLRVVTIQQLPMDDLRPLLEESREQGFEFIDRLVTEFLSGANRFERPGEGLFGIYCDHCLIAVGGLNRDPYLQNGDTGRVRHVYVLSSRRRQGTGKQLVRRIIDEARLHYRILTLRTFSKQADSFYRALGFQTEPQIAGATHHLVL